LRGHKAFRVEKIEKNLALLDRLQNFAEFLTRRRSVFSYVDLEARVGNDHPLRTIRGVNEALTGLSGEFSALYSRSGRPSIPPEKLLRAMLLQAFYSIRSERQLMERLEFDLLFRWFVGLGVDDAAWTTRRFPRTASACWRTT
jgi:transposase